MKKNLLLWAGILLLLCVGCGKEKNGVITPTPGAATDNKENPAAEATPKVTTDVFQTPKKENEVKQQGLQEKLNKVEMTDSKQYNVFNRVLSLEEPKSASLFCRDEQTGVVYFVNQNKDFFIYRIKNGEVALAVSMPAKELWSLDGNLYFMVENYGKYEMEQKNGDIYCYTPETGAVKLVYAAGGIENSKEHKLTVTEKGIFFSYTIDTIMEINGHQVTSSTTYYMQMSSNGSEPVTDKNKTTMYGWQNYYLSHPFLTEDYTVAPDLALVNREDRTDIVTLDIGRPYQYCVWEDNLYFFSGNSTAICCLNITTKEIKQYDFKDAFLKISQMESYEELQQRVEKPGTVMFQGFTLTENSLWAIDDLYLYRMDLQSNEVTVYRGNGTARLDFLYTDGQQVYGLYASSIGGGAAVARLLPTEDMHEAADCKLLHIEFLTE